MYTSKISEKQFTDKQKQVQDRSWFAGPTPLELWVYMYNVCDKLNRAADASSTDITWQLIKLHDNYY